MNTYIIYNDGTHWDSNCGRYFILELLWKLHQKYSVHRRCGFFVIVFLITTAPFLSLWIILLRKRIFICPISYVFMVYLTICRWVGKLNTNTQTKKLLNWFAHAIYNADVFLELLHFLIIIKCRVEMWGNIMTYAYKQKCEMYRRKFLNVYN